ncbi:MAG: carboxylating nicotinate-nucleotide diphosphorylase [Prevotellaceae bacterium]|jgi:nicotinate-nucleotide pyrophosphorylase (carboxylating)|nr:carboxylating nicotinate-nucleotide diphosphorylase [Prevotellaceae bacterium]
MDYQPYIDQLISLAIAEDIGDGDHTSLSCISPEVVGKMKLLVKQEGIIAGIAIARQIFHRIDSGLQVEQIIDDGTKVAVGKIAFYVSGKELSLLQAERLVLNVMQRMSGIATQTAVYAKQLGGLKTRVIDTRKTTPGMRALDKLAVILGGGGNHRMGLFDMILLKDNHIDFAGGVETAIRKAQDYLQRTGRKLAIEVEARSLNDVRTIMHVGGVQRIMLDNFDVPMTKEAVALINGRYETESSGGITLENLRTYAECGVDFISVGALTHQIKSLDLSLKVC